MADFGGSIQAILQMTLKVGIVCGECDWLNSYDRSICEDCGKEIAPLTDDRSASRRDAAGAEDASKSRAIAEERPADSAQQEAEGWAPNQAINPTR